MPAHILIRDGSPHWWLSTDVWVVPGNDPNGAPGAPLSGQKAYVWAHVDNIGDADAQNVRIDFYWANPAGQMTAGAVNYIGAGYADLPADPKEAMGQDVLCLVPWQVQIVNDGHECLLAVAHGAGDSNPIPDPLPASFSFDPPAHDQIAQRNLTVLDASKMAPMLRIAVNGLPRQDKRVRLTAEFGGELDQRQLQRLGLARLQLRPAPKPEVQVRLSLEPSCGGKSAGEKASDARVPSLAVSVPRGATVPVYLDIQASQLHPDHYQLLHIVEHDDAGKPLGGVSYVVIPQGKENRL
ncbi:hypothetical protein JQK19_19710 [Chromobacterium violaceum]|uniref:hypothetical protein n=1 Tax=Chromobacterium violaceum TaxID=536 RepID=UPI001BE7F4D2|nr:hypothetical protein [Chromobacterium violaceum]MBT2869455.1 hypothetical protein [Chromobacterium violaceum]